MLQLSWVLRIWRSSFETVSDRSNTIEFRFFLQHLSSSSSITVSFLRDSLLGLGLGFGSNSSFGFDDLYKVALISPNFRTSMLGISFYLDLPFELYLYPCLGLRRILIQNLYFAWVFLSYTCTRSPFFHVWCVFPW